MSPAPWTWQMLGEGGVVLDRPLSPAFTTRFDAEAWLGEQWRRLAGESVVAARLLDGDRVVGPEVSLRRD
ncbi:hypothetical protein [Actinotalea sp.]|uniref:hypothetical protein n=1 Tax=Actinotalea sp. TaxID=1872145 RepID=UPI003564EE2C